MNTSHLMRDTVPYASGFVFGNALMDEESLDTSLLEYFVTDKEKLTLNEREAVYIDHQSWRTPAFTQYLFIAFPEFQRILIIYATNDIPKEDFLSVAANASLVSTGEEVLTKNVVTWKEYVSMSNGFAARAGQTHKEPSASKKEDPSFATYNVGETILLDYPKNTIELTLENVEIQDNIRMLDPDYFNLHSYTDNISPLVDENDDLLPATVEFIWYGNGVDSLDTIIDSVVQERKLVYLTVVYTNVSDEAVEHLTVCPKLYLYHGDDRYDHEDLTEAAYDETRVLPYGYGGVYEMLYYDVRDDETDGANHIPYLAPGESRTVHIAWAVTEDELPYMFVRFGTTVDTKSGTYDIRVKQ